MEYASVKPGIAQQAKSEKAAVHAQRRLSRQRPAGRRAHRND